MLLAATPPCQSLYSLKSCLVVPSIFTIRFTTVCQTTTIAKVFLFHSTVTIIAAQIPQNEEGAVKSEETKNNYLHNGDAQR